MHGVGKNKASRSLALGRGGRWGAHRVGNRQGEW